LSLRQGPIFRGVIIGQPGEKSRNIERSQIQYINTSDGPSPPILRSPRLTHFHRFRTRQKTAAIG
jgi:hypothetical protein